MNSKNILIILALLAATAALGWRIAHIEPPAPREEEHEHHAHEHGKEHDAPHEHEHDEKGRVELTREASAASGVILETAGPATIARTLKLNGKIAANQETLAHLMPRFPGIVKSVHKRLGDPVKSGETLAIVESNESLRPYEIKSGLAGTVIKKEIAPGEFVSDKETLFVVADLSTVWIDLSVPRRDFAGLHEGQPVWIDTGFGEPKLESTLSYISPFGSENTQTLLARAVIPNPDGRLRPGLFVTGEIVAGERKVPVAVKTSALQTLDGTTVVFVQEGDGDEIVFEARVIKVGEQNGKLTEIRSGIAADEKYAAANSFILKAELGKGEASHEH